MTIALYVDIILLAMGVLGLMLWERKRMRRHDSKPGIWDMPEDS